jgi:hypothetical protein
MSIPTGSVMPDQYVMHTLKPLESQGEIGLKGIFCVVFKRSESLVELGGMESSFPHELIDRLSCRFIDMLFNVANQLKGADRRVDEVICARKKESRSSGV